MGDLTCGSAQTYTYEFQVNKSTPAVLYVTAVRGGGQLTSDTIIPRRPGVCPKQSAQENTTSGRSLRSASAVKSSETTGVCSLSVVRKSNALRGLVPSLTETVEEFGSYP